MTHADPHATTDRMQIHPGRMHPTGMNTPGGWVCQACGELAKYLRAEHVGAPFICGLCQQEKGR